jgi:Na+/H+-dicarboxylate symporter
MKWWFRQELHVQILIGIIIGAGLGSFFGHESTILKPIGDIFIRFLKMLIVPLTFFTLISGMTKMESLRSLRSVGGMIISYFVLTSLVAAILGIAVALVISPGEESSGLLDTVSEVEIQEFSFIDNLVSWIPTNPIQAMVTPNMFQVIIFSIIIGIGLISLGKRATRLIEIMNQGSELMIRITEIVMSLAPYGILALVANMIATMEDEMLEEVGKFIFADFVAIAIILIIVYPLLLKYIGKINPFHFYKNIAPAMFVAASTTSSSATLPVSMGVASKKLKVSEKIFGFTLPLGVTVNMDGLAAAIGVIGIFAANLYGIPVTFSLMLQFILLGLVLSIGGAGIKGAGIVMSTILLQTFNMPLTLIPILAAVWPVIDIAHTTCNVTGDLTGTAIIASRVPDNKKG